MTEKEMSQQNNQITSELNYEETVIAKIVGKTMATIQGVLSIEGNVMENLVDRFREDTDATKGVKVNLDDENKSASVTVHAVLEYGRNAPKIFDEALTEIETEIKKMTNIHLSNFKMTVSDLLTKDEWRRQNEKTRSQPPMRSQRSSRHDEPSSGDTMDSPEMMDLRQGSEHQIVD